MTRRHSAAVVRGTRSLRRGGVSPPWAKSQLFGAKYFDPRS
jgi:hypothetical protein